MYTLPRSTKNISLFIYACLILMVSHDSFGSDYKLHSAPKSYVLTIFQSHDIVLLGTRHKQPPILNFVSDLITALHDSGVTHIGLEIASDQQGKIEHFMKTGDGLGEISIPSLIDCTVYDGLI